MDNVRNEPLEPNSAIPRRRFGLDDSNDFYIHKKNKRHQKIALGIVITVSFFILIFAVIHLRSVLIVPLPPDEPGALSTAEINRLKELDQQTSQVPEYMKTRDSDGDTLTDFDEVYVYLTSAYLQDSDSDGVNDYQEIKANQDPNCPAGLVCFDGPVELTAADKEAEKLKQDLLSVNADQLRGLLLKTGKLDKAQVEAISDDELLSMYRNLIETNPQLKDQLKQMTGLDLDPATAGTAAAPVIAPEQYSIEQIRASVLQSGSITKEELAKISDATLRNMYNQALGQVQSAQ